jgi:hypothetical protein
MYIKSFQMRITQKQILPHFVVQTLGKIVFLVVGCCVHVMLSILDVSHIQCF